MYPLFLASYNEKMHVHNKNQHRIQFCAIMWHEKKRCLCTSSALRKNLCKFKNCDKSDILERLKNNRSNFFTVYNGYCNLSRFFGYQPAGMERSGMESGWYPAAQPSLSGYMISSSPRTLPQFRSGIVHFLAISCVARYRAFRSAVSLGNTLLCLFRRR